MSTRHIVGQDRVSPDKKEREETDLRADLREWVAYAYAPHRKADRQRVSELETKVARLETLLNQTLKGWDKTALTTMSEFRDLIFVDDYSWNNGLKQLNANHLGKYEQIALDICHNYRHMIGDGIVVGLNTDFKTAGQNETLPNVLKTGTGSNIKKWFNDHGQQLAKNPKDETKVIKRAFDLLCKFGQPSNVVCDGGFALFEQDTIQEIKPRGLISAKRERLPLEWQHTGNAETILVIGPRGGLFTGDGDDPREHWLTYDQLKAKYNQPESDTDLFKPPKEVKK